jgi:hypothetical protein
MRIFHISGIAKRIKRSVVSRGLGRLQKKILILLLTRGPLLRVRVLLSQIFGWPGRLDDNMVFDRAAIGERAYNSKHVTMSRALEGLRRRGLVQLYKNVSGYGMVAGLTFTGTQVAKEISELEN